MEKLHLCKGTLPEDGYGEAITDCYENDLGQLWVGNGEYGSQVNFCPYCGYKAKIKAELIIKIPRTDPMIAI